MDFLDEVLHIEENAFKEGEEIGKKRAAEESKKMSLELGRENGYYIAKEYGFIRGFTEIVDKEEHLRVEQEKIITSILATEISPQMPSEEINTKIQKLRNLFKLLLAKLKIQPMPTPEQDLF